ncbi:MAG: FAD:protein FMN transferase [Bacteroidota bacterium]
MSQQIVSRLSVTLSLLCLSVLSSELSAQVERFEFRENYMGSTFRLVLYAESQSEAAKAAQAAFKRIAELNLILSDYDPESEVNALSVSSGKGEWMDISPDLLEMLTQSLNYSQQSKGDFDITVGPLVRLWRKSVREAKLPDKKRLKKVKQSVGHQHILIQAEQSLAKLEQPGMRIDFGGIAKGYAVDEAYKVLMKFKIKTALVDGGGDMYLGPAPPGERGWHVSIQSLECDSSEKIVVLANCGIATSGDRYRYVELDGKRYSHIIHPKKGLGITQRRQVTVIAPSSTQADALASTFSVAGLKKTRRLSKKNPGVSFSYFFLQKGNWQNHTSDNFNTYINPT